jgi:predicted nucleotidyltransferase component of viral defense system
MQIKGYAPEILEKMERLSDILINIGQISFLKQRLSLYGGTALNLVYMEEPPRLSIDIDLNYRHINNEDWGEVRSKIDQYIKDILDKLRYSDKDIRIQSSYPLTRFILKYLNRENKKDTIEIEIGYLRRIPDLRSDTYITFTHLFSDEKIELLTPSPEELFANKFCTMLSRNKDRRNLRDVFDVKTISNLKFKRSLFLDLVMIEGLMHELDLFNINLISVKGFEQQLQNLIISEINIEDVENEAFSFAKGVITDVKNKRWDEFRKRFNRDGVIDFKYFNNPEIINPNIEQHPQLKWLIKNKKKSD